MSLVKLFSGLTLQDIETEINEWIKDNSKPKTDEGIYRAVAGKKTNITQTEIVHLPGNNIPFQVLVTFNLD